MSDPFAAAFCYEGGEGYCFDYENILQLRSTNLPQGLDKILSTKLQNPEKAKIVSLSTGLDARYWIMYSEDSEHWTYECGPDEDDWGKLKMWLKDISQPRVILGPRKSWLAYEVRQVLLFTGAIVARDILLDDASSSGSKIRNAASKDDPNATADTIKAPLLFDSDDNVPSGLLLWMKEQKSPPTCVTMGSNGTYCAISIDDYVLSINFRKDADLVHFLDAAKAAHKLNGVRVTFSNVGATATSLPYYVASMGNRVRLWNVHETAENFLRSRAYADFCADYRKECDDFKEAVNTSLKRLDAVDTQLRTLKEDLKKAAVKTEVDQEINDLKEDLKKAAVKTEVEQEINELKETLKKVAMKTEVENRINGLRDLINNSLDSVWAELEQRPTKEDVDDLKARIAALELKLPDSSNKDLPNGGDTNATQIPGPNPPVWKTYSRNETWNDVAVALGIPIEALQNYNQAFAKTMDADTKKFWSASASDIAVEKAVVLIPVSADTAPRRSFQTNGPGKHFTPHTSGRVIANYFGHFDIPGDMRVSVTWRNATDPVEKWPKVSPNTDYNDHTIMIPAIKYSR